MMANAIYCLQILPHTQEIRGKNPSRQWSPTEVKNCTKIYLRQGSARTPLGSLQRSPDPLAGARGEGSQPLPKNPPRVGLSGLDSPFAFPWKKNPPGAHVLLLLYLYW